MQEDRKRNYILMFLDNVLATNAMSFLSINAVITYFLNALGATTFEISLANALVGLGAVLSQPLFAKQAMGLACKLRPFIKILFAQRIILLLSIFFIPVLATSHPQWMILFFLLFWGVFNLFTGSYSPFYMSLLAKLVTRQQWGRLRGFSGAVGNIIALGSAYLIRIILKKMPFPFNYTWIFGIGAGLLILDAIDFSFLKEWPEKIAPPDRTALHYAQQIPLILTGNHKLATMIGAFSLMVISQIGLAFYALYAIRFFHAQASQIAIFTALTVTANIIGNAVLGAAADRFGHRKVLQAASLLGAAAGALILSIRSIDAVYLAFVLSNLSLTGYNLSSGILIIEVSEQPDIPMNISANVVITLIISSACMLLSSVVIDRLSFTPIFLIIILSGLGGAAILQILKFNETRHTQAHLPL